MVQALRLTSFSHGAGCACKLGPRDLTRVLDLLGPTTKPQDVLVSEETGDDAAVYRLADGTGLVLTLDFFTPLVDDAGDWAEAEEHLRPVPGQRPPVGAGPPGSCAASFRCQP